MSVDVPDRPRAHTHGTNETAEKMVLVVSSEQQKTPDALMSALRAARYAVFTLILPVVEDTPETLWADFFTTYNRTGLGERVQQIVEELARLKAKPGQVDLIGQGQAGLGALLARGVSPGTVGRAVVDTAGFESGSDEAYIPRLYASGLRRAGDLRAAALLAAPAPLCLYNTGSAFPTATIADAYRSLHAPLQIERGPLSPREIVAWLSAR